MKTIKSGLARFFAGLFLLPMLLLIVGGLQTQASAHNAHPGMASLDKSDCLSLCTNRLNSPEAVLSSSEEEKDKEPKPPSLEQYYLQFAVPASTDLRIGNINHFINPKWQPPDLYKLFENFRI